MNCEPKESSVEGQLRAFLRNLFYNEEVTVLNTPIQRFLWWEFSKLMLTEEGLSDYGFPFLWDNMIAPLIVWNLTITKMDDFGIRNLRIFEEHFWSRLSWLYKDWFSRYNKLKERLIEKEYLDPNDLRAKFRSKSDLWKRMTVDRMKSYLLSCYSRHSPSIVLEMTHSVHEDDPLRWKEVRVADWWYSNCKCIPF